MSATSGASGTSAISATNPLANSHLTNERGPWLARIHDDFKLHNRVGDAMREYGQKHPYRVKAGTVIGGGVAAVGTYLGISQIDRAITKAQDSAEQKRIEQQANVTRKLEEDLLKEKLENEKFKQQNEFASKILTDAIKTGEVPTDLIQVVKQKRNYSEEFEVNQRGRIGRERDVSTVQPKITESETPPPPIGVPMSYEEVHRMVYSAFGEDIYIKGWLPPLEVNRTNPLLYRLGLMIPYFIVQDVEPNPVKVTAIDLIKNDQKIKTRSEEDIEVSVEKISEILTTTPKAWNVLDKLSKRTPYTADLPKPDKLLATTVGAWYSWQSLQKHKETVFQIVVVSLCIAVMFGIGLVWYFLCCRVKSPRKDSEIKHMFVDNVELRPLK